MTALHRRAIAAAVAATLVAGGFALARLEGSGTRPTPLQARAERARDAASRGGVGYSVGERDGVRNAYMFWFVEPGEDAATSALPTGIDMMVSSITVSNGFANTGGYRGGTLMIVSPGATVTVFVTSLPDAFDTHHFTFPQPVPVRAGDEVYFSMLPATSSDAAFWEVTMVGRPMVTGARMEAR